MKRRDLVLDDILEPVQEPYGKILSSTVMSQYFDT